MADEDRFKGNHRSLDLSKNIYVETIHLSDITTAWTRLNIGGQYIQFKFFNCVQPSGLEVAFDNILNPPMKIYDGIIVNRSFRTIYIRAANNYDYFNGDLTLLIGEHPYQLQNNTITKTDLLRKSVTIANGAHHEFNISGTGNKIALLLKGSCRNFDLTFAKQSNYITTHSPETFSMAEMSMNVTTDGTPEYKRYEFNLHHRETLVVRLTNRSGAPVTMQFEVHTLQPEATRSRIIWDFHLLNDYNQSISAGNTHDFSIPIPRLEKLYAIDVSIYCDTGDTWSKDITFKLRNGYNLEENIFAFWDDSALTSFEYFQKLVNFAHDYGEITLLNNDGANAIVTSGVHLRYYFHD
jgi:hypothetical protein